MIIKNPSTADIPQLWALWQEAFGDSREFLQSFFSHGYSPDRCLCAAEEDKVMAAVYWFRCELHGQRIAYLYALATAPRYRGQGIAHKLLDQVYALLKQQEYEGVILVPGTKSLYALYESMGFRVCTQIREFSCTNAATAVPLRRVTPEEYARQRRDLLSALEPGGVIQEKENLEFLSTQAELYCGQNFLLAARGEGTILNGIELLGDTRMAPGIVKALGYAQGIFHTPGKGEPFAMYRPLGGSTLAPPSYFGLAFD